MRRMVETRAGGQTPRRPRRPCRPPGPREGRGTAGGAGKRAKGVTAADIGMWVPPPSGERAVGGKGIGGKRAPGRRRATGQARGEMHSKHIPPGKFSHDNLGRTGPPDNFLGG